VRQVGQLPRIIAWCTVNKTLNFISCVTKPAERPAAEIVQCKESHVFAIVTLKSCVR